MNYNNHIFDYYLIGLTEKDNSKAIKSYQKATKIDETLAARKPDLKYNPES